jgi:DNA processing protein
MVKNDLRYWVGFNIVPGIGRVKFSQLQSYFKDLADAWQAPAAELKKAGLDNGTVQAMVELRPKIDLDAEMAKLEKLQIKAIRCLDTEYPESLKEIFDYPPLLYIKGRLAEEAEPCLAVVGTRSPTVYGRQVAEIMAEELAQNGICVVSGLARGIDTAAHRRTLEKGGRTLAVLAGGLDSIYPAENNLLARRICENGALVSEYPVGAKPRPENFPRRNRIMSGMSLGVLVIEADEASGAIITANIAAEQNREVFAVPGSILSPKSRGTNKLIQDGAKLVRNSRDILEELNIAVTEQQITLPEKAEVSETEDLLLKQLSSEPLHIDLVCRRCGLPAATVSSNLALLELKGLVRQVNAMNFVLAR